jgi:hypothetical protein
MNHLLFGMSPLIGGMPQVAVTMQKHIFDHIRLKAEEATEAELFTQYGTDPDSMVSALQREAMIAIKTAEYYQEAKKIQTDLQGPPPEDPLVKVKEQEIQARAANDQAKDSNEKAKIQLDAQKMQPCKPKNLRFRCQNQSQNLKKYRLVVIHQRKRMFIAKMRSKRC